MDPIQQMQETIEKIAGSVQGLGALKAQVDGIVEKITQSGASQDAINKALAELETRLESVENATSKRSGSIPGLEDEAREWSWSRFITALHKNDWTKAGFEKEVTDIATEKALSLGTGTEGGVMVPDEVLLPVMEALRAQAVIFAAGAVEMPFGGRGQVNVPKVSSEQAAAMVAENGTVDLGDMTFGEVVMRPHQAMAVIPLSNMLRATSQGAADQIVVSSLTEQIALRICDEALFGDGTGAHCTGLVANSEVSDYAIGTDGGALTFDHAVKMVGVVEDNNALRGKPGIIWHGKVKRLLQLQKIAQFDGDTDGDFVIRPTMSDANVTQQLGFPHYTYSRIPTNITKAGGTNLSRVFFGDWSRLWVGMWGGIEVLASNVAGYGTNSAFLQNQTWIRALKMFDIGIIYPEAFVRCSDAATS